MRGNLFSLALLIFLAAGIAGCTAAQGSLATAGAMDTAGFSRVGDMVGTVESVEATNVLNVSLLDGSTLEVRLWGVSDYSDDWSLSRDQIIGTIEATCKETSISLRFDENARMFDDNKRPLVFIKLENGAILNERIVRYGLAEADASYDFPQIEKYRALQEEARVFGRGIWE